MNLTSKKSISTLIAVAAFKIVIVFAFVAFAGTAFAAGSGGLSLSMKVAGGGSARPSDFEVQMKQNGVTNGGTLIAQGDNISFDGLKPGTYTLLIISGPSGYAPVWSGSCSAAGVVTIVVGQTASCTATMTYGTGIVKITNVIKGGSASAANFTITLTKSGATTGIAASGSPVQFSNLTAGSYTASITMPANYSAVWSGSCGSTGSLTVANNTTTSCTVTTTYKAPATGGGGGTTPVDDSGRGRNLSTPSRGTR